MSNKRDQLSLHSLIPFSISHCYLKWSLISIGSSQDPKQKLQSWGPFCDRGLWPGTSSQPMRAFLYSYTNRCSRWRSKITSAQWEKKTRAFKNRLYIWTVTSQTTRIIRFISQITQYSQEFSISTPSYRHLITASPKGKRKGERNQQQIISL